jgi:hypothetical protein
MHARIRGSAIASVALAGLMSWPAATRAQEGDWRSSFVVPVERLQPNGSNPYFPLEPGLRMTYRGRTRTLVRTVLLKTATVGGVRTRGVEDREERDGRPIEVSRDYYAIDPMSGDLYYFGERVDNYRNGKVSSHEGTWLAGEEGARFGLALPGQPKVGDRFYEELAPGRAMDRAEVVGTDERVVTPAGTFEHCVHLRESSALDRGEKGESWFAPSIGMVKDDEYSLVKIQRPQSGQLHE